MPTLALSALPAWNQQQVLLPDGDYDPQRYNDCGETCVAAIVTAVHGTPISPASVRANIGGVARSGITDGPALVAALAFYAVAGLAAFPRADELEGFLAHYTRLGMPTIVLGLWPTPGTALHWMLTVGTDGSWQYINVWNGNHSWLDWEDTLRYYRSCVVVATAGLRYDMRKLALPF